MADTRLGKGLGALFPAIAEETTPASTAAKKDADRGPAAKEPVEKGPAAKGTAAKGSVAEDSMVKDSKAAEPAKADRAADAAGNAQSTDLRQSLTKASAGSSRDEDVQKSVSRETRKRSARGSRHVPIPKWNDLASPSDIFFASTEGPGNGGTPDGGKALDGENVLGSGTALGNEEGCSEEGRSHRRRSLLNVLSGKPVPGNRGGRSDSRVSGSGVMDSGVAGSDIENDMKQGKSWEKPQSGGSDSGNVQEGGEPVSVSDSSAESSSAESFGQSGVSRETSDMESARSDMGSVRNANAVSVEHANGATAVRGEGRLGDTAPGDADLVPVRGAFMAEIPIDAIVPNEHQPRTIFDEDDLRELSESIKQVGVLQPVVVRRIPRGLAGEKIVNEAKNPEAKYELIMGERRLRASKMAGLEEIPAIVKTTTDSEMLREALLENLQRVQLNPLEEAAAYQQMMQEFKLTQQQLSEAVSKSRPQIANTLRLLQLPPSVQRGVASGKISAGHARALLGLKDPKDMVKLARRIIREGLSVRSTEEIVALETGNAGSKAAKRRAAMTYWKQSPLPRRLEDHFDTKVSIRGTEEKGRIEISFSSPEELNRITDLLMQGNPEDVLLPTPEEESSAHEEGLSADDDLDGLSGDHNSHDAEAGDHLDDDWQ